MSEINNYVHEIVHALLWASTRMAYMIISAEIINTDIITMQTDILKN